MQSWRLWWFLSRYENHVRSKRHKKNEALLKDLIEEEEKAFNRCDNACSNGEVEINDDSAEQNHYSDEPEDRDDTKNDAEVSGLSKLDLSERGELRFRGLWFGFGNARINMWVQCTFLI